MGNKQDGKSSTELTPQQIALLRANTNYNEQEIRKWHSGFISDCPDGKLNKDKFIQLYQQFYPQGKAENYCKHAFATFDKNHDGTIDFEEFLLSVSVTNSGSDNDRLAAAFDMYDTSNDGQIDQKELTNMISAMYDLVGQNDRKGDYDPKRRAEEIISKLDVGGDRKLDKREFITGCKNDPYLRKILAPTP